MATPLSSLTLASPSGRSRASSVAWGGWGCGEGPGARPAPGRRLALPARLRGLDPAWLRRPARREPGRQVSLSPAPLVPPNLGRRGQLGGCHAVRTAAGRASARPWVPICPGTRSLALHTGTVRSGTRPAPPAAGEGSAPGERLTPGIPSTPNFTSSL
ncbi:hypothetical protein ACRRTK_014433 [Alexandromys fortis]